MHVIAFSSTLPVNRVRPR